jgi:DNA-binding NtrC family response regulator
MNIDLPVILIVDDEESLRRNLREFLLDEGYEVLTAESGEEGLDVLRNRAADIAVVDIRLPGMDGNDFIMAAHRMFPQMKFLVFTGSIEYTLPKELKLIGITDQHVLEKPLNDLTILAELIATLFEKDCCHGENTPTLDDR